MNDTQFFSKLAVLNEAAGAMGALKNKDFQKMLAACGAGENSKHVSKTVTIQDVGELSKQMNLGTLARLTKDGVAGVVCYWNGDEVMIRTCDGKSKAVNLADIKFPGFLTTVCFNRDEARREIAGFRDMAATAPVRRIIVNAIRTLRTNADKLEANVNQGDMTTLTTLCAALRESVNLIEMKAKELA